MAVVSCDFGRSGKIKSSNAKAILAHNFRKPLSCGKDFSDNVDSSRSKYNEYWINPKFENNGLPDYEKAIEVMQTKKFRANRFDAVLLRSFVFQVTPEFFFPKIEKENWSIDKIKHSTFQEREPLNLDNVNKWKEVIFKFCKDKFGDKLLSLELHLDESSPHIHAQISPITEDGRLCNKEILNGIKDCKSFLDELAIACKPLGIHRAIEGGKKTTPIEIFRSNTEDKLNNNDNFVMPNTEYKLENEIIIDNVNNNYNELKQLPDELIPSQPLPKPKSILGIQLSDLDEWKIQENNRIENDKEKALNYINTIRRNEFKAINTAKEAQTKFKEVVSENIYLKNHITNLEYENIKIKSDLDKLTSQLRDIPLEEVLSTIYNATLIEGKIGKSKTTQWKYNERKIAVTESKFIDNHDPDNCKGRKAIDLVMKLSDVNFDEARSILKDYFGTNRLIEHIKNDHNLEKMIEHDPIPNKPQLPKRIDDITPLFDLARQPQRRISKQLMNYLYKTNQCYIDNYKNMVVPRLQGGCFLQGTRQPRPGERSWKGTLGGKSCSLAKLHGEKYNPDTKPIICESITDALALIELYKEHEIYIIGGNLRPDIPQEIANNCILAFDNDEEGRKHTEFYKTQCENYEILEVPNNCKDWSQYYAHLKQEELETLRSQIKQGPTPKPKPK